MRAGASKLAVLIAMLALIAGACRDSGAENNVSARDVASDVGVTSEPCPNAVTKETQTVFA